MKATADQWRLRWILGGLVLVSTAIGLVSWGVRNPALEGRAHGERKERWTGRTFAKQTEVHLQPTASSMAPGWDSERVWSGLDDWEPFVAADPSSTYVYQMTTRFNDTMSAVMIRASSDSGKTWGSAQFVAPVNEWQADPQVAVANDG